MLQLHWVAFNWIQLIGAAIIFSVALLIYDHYWRNRCANGIDDTREETRKECANGAASQIAALTEQSKGFYAMKEDVDEITLYLRDHYRVEIQQGFHQGRGLGKIVIGYLGRERQLMAQTTAVLARPVTGTGTVVQLQTPPIAGFTSEVRS